MSINNKEKSLSKLVVNSTMWLFTFQILDNLLGFIRIIILARLLTPSAFGLIGVAWLILQIINMFTLTGIQQVLIHKQKIEEYINVAWTFLLIRGIVLYLIIFITAPYIGNFFNSKEVATIVQALGLTLLINGFGNIGTIYFQKELQFNKQFHIQITQNSVDFIVTLIFALYLQNVWAIVYGAIANSLTGCILSYIISQYRPKFEWNLKKIKAMNNYGKWIGGSNILQFLYSQGDDILVGKILGVTALGYYQLAYRISNLPATQITHIISTVMFPAYSKLQNSKDKLRDVYINTLQITAFLTLITGTLIIIFSYDFTKLFLGEKWLPIILSMQLLTVWGMIRSIGAAAGPLWQAIGTPGTVTKIQLIQVIIMFSIIFPVTMTYGIAGTSFVVVISALIPNIISLFLINRTLHMKISSYLKELTFPFIGSLIIVFIHYGLHSYVFIETSLVNFILLAFICLFSYLGITILFSKFLNYSLYKNVYTLMEGMDNKNVVINVISRIVYKIK